MTNNNYSSKREQQMDEDLQNHPDLDTETHDHAIKRNPEY